MFVKDRAIIVLSSKRHSDTDRREKMQNLQITSCCLSHACPIYHVSYLFFPSPLSSDSVMLKLFPKTIQTSLDVSTINFNAVATTFVASCLKKISAKESAADSNLVNVNSAQIDAIVVNANGDLRAAINNLQVGLDWYRINSRD